MKIVVGKKYKLLNTEGGCLNGFKAGETVTVLDTDVDGRYPIMVEAGCTGYCDPEQLQELKRPTVGDTVRILSITDPEDKDLKSKDHYVGQLAKVTKDAHDEEPYQLNGKGWWFMEEAVELVEGVKVHPELEALKASHAKMLEDIKALEAKIAKEAEAAKRPEVSRGQVWKHKRSNAVYLATTPESASDKLIFVSLVHSQSSYYAAGKWITGFKDDLDSFEYLGMAEDVLTVEGQA